jgi:hypothetical protein
VTVHGPGWLALLALALSGSLPVACARHIPPPSAPTPVMDRPAASIPADLDIAIRLDLAQARGLFGPTIGQALQVDIVDSADDPKTASLVSDALGHADVVWVAFRPGLATKLTDNVLVLRGTFDSIDPPRDGKGAWGAPTDLGAAFRVYARPAPKRRSAPSRLYARADDWLVFVSEAEVDAAERAIELRAGDDHLDPSEHGILSIAARVPPLLPLVAPKYPLVAEALSSAVRLEAVADADDRGLRAELEVHYDNDADAKEGRERLLPLLSALQRAEGPLGRLARGAEASALGPVLLVRIRLDAPSLAAMIGCFDKAGGC